MTTTIRTIATDLVEHLTDGYAEGWLPTDLDAATSEALDAVFPVYTTDIIDAWNSAGSPEPDDMSDTINSSITYALYERLSEEMFDAVSEAQDSATEKLRDESGELFDTEARLEIEAALDDIDNTDDQSKRHALLVDAIDELHNAQRNE